MSQKLNMLKFIAQSIILGLAIGFLIVFFKPTLLGNKNSTQGNNSTAPISYSKAVKKIAPSVVSIYTTSLVNSNSLTNELKNNPGLKSLIPQSMTQQYLGSGVIMTEDGYIITSYHVIEQALQIIVSLWDNTILEAKIIGFDNVTDLAVLKIEAIDLKPATFADSDLTETGDVVMTVGNPFGLSQSVSLGIISAKGRSGINLYTIEDFIQTDASINEGNSGGPLINAFGNVVGISSATFNSNGAQGINFAIPSNVTQLVMQEIQESGKVSRGWLGVQLVPPLLLSKSRIAQPEQGVMIMAVARYSPADKSKLKQKDIITHVNDIAIQNNYHYYELIAKTKPGETIEVSGFSSGKAFRKSLMTIDRPPELKM